MLDMRFAPVDQWPGEKTKSRKTSHFKTPYTKSLDLLERELGHLGAKNIIVQAYFTRSQLRNDGWPAANQRPSEPGIILTFDTKRGTVSFPCDTYYDFTSNIHALALSLEALRAVDRHGVTRSGEQYKGWLALPAPGSNNSFAHKEDAAEWLAVRSGGVAGRILREPDYRKDAYAEARRRAHPDTPGGSHELFVMVQKAMELLSA